MSGVELANRLKKRYVNIRPQLANLALTIVVSALMLVTLELLARIAGTVDQDWTAKKQLSPDRWLIYSPVFGWERKPGFKGMVGHADREFDSAGYFTADSKQVAATTGNKRIVFLGDSNTFGFGASTPASFVEVVDQLLPNVDAINLGTVGYSSYQGHLALEKYLPLLKPDLIVVSFNFNDRRYVMPPDGIDSPLEFQRVYRASESTIAAYAQYLEMSYIYRGLRRIMRKAGLAPEPVFEANVSQLKPRVDEASYRRNLSLIAAEAKRLGIPVMFVLLRDNPIQSEHLKKGIADLAAHDYDMAIAYLNTVAESRTMFSELARVYLTRAYAAKGHIAQAAETAVTRSTYRSFSGGALIRLDTDYNEIMRQVATENGMPLLDGAAVLEKHASVFIDFCHFNTEGHRLLGEHLAARIAEILTLEELGK